MLKGKALLNKTFFNRALTNKLLLSIAVTILISCNVHAADSRAEKSTTLNSSAAAEADITAQPIQKSVLDERDEMVDKSTDNPFSLSQHKLNYILPFTYVSDPNTLDSDGLNTQNVDHVEAKYQISVKFPIYQAKLNTSGLYLGFTAVSFWQAYNKEVSKPFRETNYEPELFYSWRSDFSFAGFKFNQVRLGLNHQSNGQSGLRSRSWNRLYASAMFSDDDSYYYLKLWYRFKESEKEDPFDQVGDDNPDITHFMGYGELGYGTKLGAFNITALVRNNLKSNDNKGSIELNLSYPINERYDILLQYFNGYGDSLIDYNRHQKRIGLGIQLKFL
ncbi:phospholipase A [Colwellia sp. E2M01]|uniref:phospholipase A n=1 Tax=Colwellia sp. E2M01 TaxID=2841561 RepID=UPI001C083A37|nr:phospholipase A [Colwellia sp. E2M01]MBU2869633.1 phospholipase A [Colwellia sp. E2M01]